LSLKRRSTKELQKLNIEAGAAMGELVRNSFGPCGMSKMISDDKGQTTLTGDVAAIVRALQVRGGWYRGPSRNGDRKHGEIEPTINNPICKIMAQAAAALDVELGDGIKSMLILAGALLANAEHLLDDGLASDLIVSGYKKAYDKAVQILTGTSLVIAHQDASVLRNLAMTSIRSKDVGAGREHLLDISMAASNMILDDYPWGSDIDMNEVLENVKFVKRSGKSVADTEMIKGLIVEKAVVNSGMPERVDNARLLVLESPLELDRKAFHVRIEGRQGSLKAFQDQEDRLRDSWVRKVAECAANVVVCQRGIDVKTQSSLAKNGVLGVHWVNRRDVEGIAKATGAKVMTSISDVGPEDLGAAEIVEERTVGTDKMVLINGCKQPKCVSIMIRAGLDKEADEAERALSDAICSLASVRSCDRIVGGAGAVEMEVAKKLRSYAVKVSSKEQHAIGAFVDSLETIPENLARNAGLDVTDVKLALRLAHEKEEGSWLGINVLSRKIENTLTCGIIEPYSVKKQVLRTAVEVASTIIRTANIISFHPNEETAPSAPTGDRGA